MQPDIKNLMRELRELQDVGANQPGEIATLQTTRTQLERKLIDAIMGGSVDTNAQLGGARTYRWLFLAVLTSLAAGLVFGAGGYAWWAQRKAKPVVQAETTATPVSASGAQEVDRTDWASLARTDASRGRFRESLPHFKRAEAQRPDDAQILADHAEAHGYVHVGRPDAEHAGLLAKALTLDPRNVKALVLAGSAALQSQEFGIAIEQLSRAVQHVPSEHAELRKLIESRLAEARRGAQAQPSASTLLKPTPATPP